MKLKFRLKGSQAGVALNNALGDGVACQPGYIMDAQLVHDLLPVLFYRFDADTQLGGNLLIGSAFGD